MIEIYYIPINNPVQLNVALKKLTRKGLKLVASHSCYLSAFRNSKGLSSENFCLQVSMSDSSIYTTGYPSATNAQFINVSEIDKVIKKEKKPAQPLVFPKAAKYNLRYKKTDGARKSYTVSNPIEEDSNKITTYVFGQGIKSFKKNQILEFRQLS